MIIFSAFSCHVLIQLFCNTGLMGILECDDMFYAPWQQKLEYLRWVHLIPDMPCIFIKPFSDWGKYTTGENMDMGIDQRRNTNRYLWIFLVIYWRHLSSQHDNTDPFYKNYKPYNKQVHISGYHHNCNVLQLKRGSCRNRDTSRDVQISNFTKSF